MAKRKRMAEPPARHLWKVTIRHRDYVATMENKRLYMNETTLLIVSPQPAAERPDIDKAIARARRLLRRCQRMYGIPGIIKVVYDGFLDELA
jgi:hypothetical protein